MPVENKEKNKKEALLAAFLASNALLLSVFKDLDMKISKLKSTNLTDEEIIKQLIDSVEPTVKKNTFINFFMPVQTAFMLAIDKVFEKRSVDYYRYNTQLDNRVRPSHRLLEGNIYDRTTSLGQNMLPPLSWGCRCYITPVSEEEGKKKVVRKAPKQKPEFFAPPGSWKLDSAGYPTGLWREYLKVKRKAIKLFK